MTETKKQKACCCSAILVPCLLILAFLYWLFFDGTIKQHVKTEYGDSFTFYSLIGMPDDTDWLEDDNSDFEVEFDEDSTVSKSDFKTIHDPNYYRCYQIESDNGRVHVNVYIYKDTEDGPFYYKDYSENRIG